MPARRIRRIHMHAQHGSDWAHCRRQSKKGRGSREGCHLQGQSNHPHQPTAVAETSVLRCGYIYSLLLMLLYTKKGTHQQFSNVLCSRYPEHPRNRCRRQRALSCAERTQPASTTDATRAANPAKRSTSREIDDGRSRLQPHLR